MESVVLGHPHLPTPGSLNMWPNMCVGATHQVIIEISCVLCLRLSW